MPAPPAKTDAEQARHIAAAIALKMLEKTGVQEWENARQTTQITKRAVEMATAIIEAFPER